MRIDIRETHWKLSLKGGPGADIPLGTTSISFMIIDLTPSISIYIYHLQQQEQIYT